MTDTNTTGSLPGTIKSAPTDSLGFDTNTIVEADVAKQFFDDKYKFCLRYVGRTQMATNDLTTKEATNILDAGLALMVVQHVLKSPWTPTAALGTEYGENAARFTAEIGFPSGVNVWLDLEGVATSTSAQTVIDYCNNWYDAVFSKGFVPGIYVGFNCILTGDQLYNNLKFQHYWQSGSKVPEITTRGYQMVQYDLNTVVNGIQIDKDKTQTDNLGGQAQWLVK